MNASPPLLSSHEGRTVFQKCNENGHTKSQHHKAWPLSKWDNRWLLQTVQLQLNWIHFDWVLISMPWIHGIRIYRLKIPSPSAPFCKIIRLRFGIQTIRLHARLCINSMFYISPIKCYLLLLCRRNESQSSFKRCQFVDFTFAMIIWL